MVQVGSIYKQINLYRESNRINSYILGKREVDQFDNSRSFLYVFLDTTNNTASTTALTLVLPLTSNWVSTVMFVGDNRVLLICVGLLLLPSSFTKEALSNESEEAMSCSVSGEGWEVLISASLSENTWRNWESGWRIEICRGPMWRVRRVGWVGATTGNFT